MKKGVTIGISIAIVIVVLIVAYYLISPAWRDIEVNENRTQGETTLQGAFMAQAHNVAGEALVIENETGRVLRFENFETINGPSLHIYLSKDLEAKEYIDLGDIKATKGNVSYSIPEGVNLAEYNKVLVWCEPFSVLFSSAELA